MKLLSLIVLSLSGQHKQQHMPWHIVCRNTLLFQPSPLLDEAHEGSDSSPRADHDDRVGGFEGQAELRLADVHGNGGLVAVVSDQFVLQPVGGDSLVDAAGLGVVLHHHGADVDAVRVNLQNRGELSTVLLKTPFKRPCVKMKLVTKVKKDGTLPGLGDLKQGVTLEDEAME